MFSERIGSWKKVIAGFAGFGFILSFILGLIGEVFIGAVILRAFIFALFFAGISLLILKLIDGYIPELLNAESSNDEEDSAAVIEGIAQNEGEAEHVSGKKLDITVEDEEEISYSAEPGSAQELEALEAAEDISEGEKPERSDADVIEEVEEVEEVEELEEAVEAEAADSAKSSKASAGGALPDIATYSDSFEQQLGATDSDVLSSIDGTGKDGAEILGGMHNTDELVKAVKTVLKKDQEG